MKIRQDAWTEENDLLLAETVLRHVREGSTQLNAFEEVGDKLNRTSAACGFRWNAVVRHSYEKALQLAKKQRKQRQRMLGKDQGGKKKLLYQPPTPSLDSMPTKTHTPVEDTSTFEPDEYTAPTPTPEFMTTMNNYSTESDDNYFDELETSFEKQLELSFGRSLQSNLQSNTGKQMNLDTIINYLQNLDQSHIQVERLKNENERLRLENQEMRKRNEELERKVHHLESNSETIQEDYETLMKIMNRARKLVLFDEEERPANKFKMDRNGNLEKVAE